MVTAASIAAVLNNSDATAANTAADRILIKNVHKNLACTAFYLSFHEFVNIIVTPVGTKNSVRTKLISSRRQTL